MCSALNSSHSPRQQRLLAWFWTEYVKRWKLDCDCCDNSNDVTHHQCGVVMRKLLCDFHTLPINQHAVRIADDNVNHSRVLFTINCMGALQLVGRVGHNAFGPTKNRPVCLLIVRKILRLKCTKFAFRSPQTPLGELTGLSRPLAVFTGPTSKGRKGGWRRGVGELKRREGERRDLAHPKIWAWRPPPIH